MGHIAVELRTEAEEEQHRRNDKGPNNNPAMIFRREGRQLIQHAVFPLPVRLYLDIMGQIEDDKEDGSHQQQGGKQTQVPQGWGRKRHQCQKGAYSGNITHYQRG